MEVHGKRAAPCGLYCGVCAIYIAHREDNFTLKEKLTGCNGVALEELHCRGCGAEADSDGWRA